jgi:hypothetical protein
LVFWISEDDGALRYALKMAPTGRPDSVVVTIEKPAGVIAPVRLISWNPCASRRISLHPVFGNRTRVADTATHPS